MAPKQEKDSSQKSGFISAMGNFSIQYNLSAASAALPLMDGENHLGIYPQPDWVNFTLKGMVFAGAVVGMCIMGYLGDLIGRKRALILTLSLTCLGALGCALFPWGDNVNVIYAVICICRFILGVGAGGIYPLSAVAASESSVSHAAARSNVGWAFFWQTPGAMFPYLVGLILLQLHDTSTVTQVQFRLLMGLGVIPAGIVLIAAFGYEDSKMYKKMHTRSPLHEALEHRAYWKHLIGTAGTWFLYDVAYYGINIFTPEIIKNILGTATNEESMWHEVVSQSIGIPGCILAIVMLQRKGTYWLMLYGFWLIAICFGAFAIVYQIDSEGLSTLKFILYCALVFSLNFGPNVATYVLPTTCFPVQVRSLFHGLSAASAKLGAVVGTYLFQPLSDAWGVSGLMWFQMGLSIIGALVTIKYVDNDHNPEIEKLDAAEEAEERRVMLSLNDSQ